MAMMKRPRDIYDTPESSSPPEIKRVRTGHASSSLVPSSPYTPASSRSTPYTPYSFLRTPFSIPSDSPSNPFGIKRALVALTLPRAIGFAKHIALRFQLVYGEDADAGVAVGHKKKRKRHDGEGERGKSRDREGAYRVVQVPTNYTIRHLHKLVLFLFASDIPLRTLAHGTATATAHRRSARVAEKRNATSAAKKPRPSDASAKAKIVATALRVPTCEAGPSTVPVRPRADDPEIPDGWMHFFDVRMGISFYNKAYKPGVIKPGSGRTYARLSSVRERRLFPHLYEELNDADEDVFGSARERAHSGLPEENEPEEDEEEEQGWIWEAEDDFTIAHVWPNGPKLNNRGIIYHHLPGVAVHITINTMRLPRRKGVGNTPYVFRARRGAHGAVRIAHLATMASAGPPVPPDPPDVDIDGGADDDDPAPWDEVPHLRRWNAHSTFARFLEREGAREGTRRAPAPASPSLSPAPHSPHLPSSPLPASSPTSLRALELGSSPVSTSGADVDVDADVDAAYLLDPLSALPTTTPFPAHPAARRRVTRAGRVLARLTESGLSEMSSDEEDEEDELAEDDPPEEVGLVEEIDKSDWEQWEWDWDPFGEPEI